MQQNYRGVYDSTQSYAQYDVVSFTSSGTTNYYLCLTANNSASPVSPTAGTDNSTWGIINTLSTFPNSVDSFIQHTYISASDQANVDRWQTLTLQSSLTPSEQDELNNLTQTLRSKLILPDDINFLQESINNMQQFFLDNVNGYINQKQSEFNAKINKFSDQGVYSSSTTYQATNFVTYANETYICLVDNTVGVAPTDTTKWRKVAAQGGKGDPGLTASYKGEYDSSASYVLGDAVSYQGIFYYAKTSVSGVSPTDNTKWQLFNNLVIASSAPSAPATDQGWFDVNTNKIKYWNGTTWIENNAAAITDGTNTITPSQVANHLSDYAHQYSSDTGSANTYVVTLSPAPTTYTTGMLVYFKATNANTGASTVNVNGLGVKTIKKNISTDLASGDIKAGQVILLVYDGTNFQFTSSASGSNFNPLTSPSAWIN